MKKTLTLIISLTISLTVCVVSFSQQLSPESDTVCGGEEVEYDYTRSSHTGVFQRYEWHVEGGLFANGTDDYEQTNKYSTEATVIWSTTPQDENASLICKEVYIGTQLWDIIYPVLLSVAQPNAIQGDFIVPTGSETIPLSTGTAYPWHVDNYHWAFSPVGGTPRALPGGTSGTSSLSLTGTEYGEVAVLTYNEHCEMSSTARTATISRKLPLPIFLNPDLIMCNNTTTYFYVTQTLYATNYSWESSGGFQLWHGNSWGTSAITDDNRVLVKAPASDVEGTISVIAKREGATLDSEEKTIDLWSGEFSGPSVSGTSAVCHNSMYTYTAQVPVGSPSSYSYSWTYPSGWSVLTSSSNSITLATPTQSGNMTYGTVRARINNGCGWSVYSGMTVYPGYSCGGYYMASPNPAGEYTEIDIVSEEAKTLEASYDSEITLTVVDKMGAPMMKEVVYSLPHQLNTSKLPKGEYVIHIIDQAKDRETRVDALKIIVNR